MQPREYQLRAARCQAHELTADDVNGQTSPELAAFVEASGAAAGDYIVKQGEGPAQLVKRADFLATWELPAGLTCDDVTGIVRRLEALERKAPAVAAHAAAVPAVPATDAGPVAAPWPPLPSQLAKMEADAKAAAAPAADSSTGSSSS